jgi:hypothetical protein|nr:MAG TPA: Rad50 zinc hook motif [Bacteriophage sp.]
MTAKKAIEFLRMHFEYLKERWKPHPDYNVLEAIRFAISAIEKQIPKKPYKDNENGIYEKECCPTCNRSLFPNDHHCICGQAIDWSDEE